MEDITNTAPTTLVDGVLLHNLGTLKRVWENNWRPEKRARLQRDNSGGISAIASSSQVDISSSYSASALPQVKSQHVMRDFSSTASRSTLTASELSSLVMKTTQDRELQCQKEMKKQNEILSCILDEIKELRNNIKEIVSNK